MNNHFYWFSESDFECSALIWAQDLNSAIKCFEAEVRDHQESDRFRTPEKHGFAFGIKKMLSASCDDSELFCLLRNLFTQESPRVFCFTERAIL